LNIVEKSLFALANVVWQQFVGDVGTFTFFMLASFFTMSYVKNY